MNIFKKGLFVCFLASTANLIFANTSTAASPAASSAISNYAENTTLQLRGVKPATDSLIPNTFSVKLLKNSRQKQLRDRGLKVVVWVGEVDVTDPPTLS